MINQYEKELIQRLSTGKIKTHLYGKLIRKDSLNYEMLKILEERGEDIKKYQVKNA